MAEDVAPLAHLDAADAANAPGLSYNVPDPTSFPGRSYITLDFGVNDPFGQNAPEGAGQPAPGIHPQLMPQRPDPGANPPHDPPEPQAVLSILEPAAGLIVESGPDGFDLKVIVQATISHTSERPPTATVTVNGASTDAPEVGEPASGVRQYATTVRVKPGTVTVFAGIRLSENGFSTLAPRQIEIRLAAAPPAPDTTPPTVSIDYPASGMHIPLSSAGAVTLTVTGSAQDPNSGLAAGVYFVDGAPSQPVTVAADGSYSIDLTLTAAGDHQIVVLVKNNAGLSGQAARQFTTTASPRRPRHRLMLVECLRLSNFLGRYGAGRIVQTFSLLPGEKTTITIRTFNTESSTATDTSSIFDSYSQTTGDELSTAITAEDTSKSHDEQSLKDTVNVKAGANWGWGTASVEAGLAYGTSSAREQLTKNVTNGTTRHAADKSSKRDVKVDTTKTVSSTVENEQTVLRNLANTSLSRTLNFVFRQMTQEFVSILHLVDIRVAHLTEWFEPDGTRSMVTPDAEHPERQLPLADYEEVSLPQLHALLQTICADAENANLAEATIRRQLDAVFDYRGQWHKVVENVSRQVPSRDPLTGKIRTDPAQGNAPVMETLSWNRFDPNLEMTYPDPPADGASTSITVPGVILAITTNTLRADAVVTDVFPGGGNALDSYGERLQTALARSREAEAGKAEKEIERVTEAMALTTAGDSAKAAVFATVFPPPATTDDDQNARQGA
ncbi:Ig-like domain-containing protein [Amycolatopsis sp. NPDC101161]|uniref:Ig-like domain-containing protein n=1 Tax=Amycolatopsis sp. NPDC101161 TaxID=3363940 RepID=UPI00381B08DB